MTYQRLAALRPVQVPTLISDGACSPMSKMSQGPTCPRKRGRGPSRTLHKVQCSCFPQRPRPARPSRGGADGLLQEGQALMRLPHICTALSHTLDRRTDGGHLCVVPSLCPHKRSPILVARQACATAAGHARGAPQGSLWARYPGWSHQCRTPWSQGTWQETHTAQRGRERWCPEEGTPRRGPDPGGPGHGHLACHCLGETAEEAAASRV